jgi:hypothetical protein
MPSIAHLSLIRLMHDGCPDVLRDVGCRHRVSLVANVAVHRISKDGTRKGAKFFEQDLNTLKREE